MDIVLKKQTNFAQTMGKNTRSYQNHTRLQLNIGKKTVQQTHH